MKKLHLLAVPVICAVLLAGCTRNGTATDTSPDHGAQNAEGGTTPNASSMKDSMEHSRNNSGPVNVSPDRTGTYDDTVPRRHN